VKGTPGGNAGKAAASPGSRHTIEFAIGRITAADVGAMVATDVGSAEAADGRADAQAVNNRTHAPVTQRTIARSVFTARRTLASTAINERLARSLAAFVSPRRSYTHLSWRQFHRCP
jgi:hypothetical protein